MLVMNRCQIWVGNVPPATSMPCTPFMYRVSLPG